MKNTTLCYIENPQGEYLMLHRVKKENDLNRDKWIGVGGKFNKLPAQSRKIRNNDYRPALDSRQHRGKR
mgnify:CR=1 FL=1